MPAVEDFIDSTVISQTSEIAPCIGFRFIHDALHNRRTKNWVSTVFFSPLKIFGWYYNLNYYMFQIATQCVIVVIDFENVINTVHCFTSLTERLKSEQNNIITRSLGFIARKSGELVICIYLMMCSRLHHLIPKWFILTCEISRHQNRNTASCCARKALQTVHFSAEKQRIKAKLLSIIRLA